MARTLTSRWLLALIGLVSTVGAIDALIGGQIDLAVLHVVVLGLVGLLVLHTAIPGRMVPVRSDLARWLEQRAAAGSERPADVADRAIAAYRAGVLGELEVRGVPTVADR